MNSAPLCKADYAAEDIVFAFTMLLCGFLYWNLISVESLGAGVAVFTALFCIAAAVYLRQGGFRQTGKSLLCLAIIALSASAFLLFDNMLIKGFNFIFLSVTVVYWISLATGRTLENRISIYILGDIVNQLIAVPFRNFSCCFGGIKHLVARHQKGRGILAGALGVLMILPVLFLVVSLLVSADAVFEGFVSSIRITLSEDIVEYIVQFLMGVPVACYLYGLVYGDRYERHTGTVSMESADRHAASLRFVPGMTVYAALAALNIVYVLFFLTQTTYLFSAFGNSLPEFTTYSEYARRGFFELCAVAGIDLAVIAFAHIVAKRERVKVLQIETAVLCVFTLMLITTALSKMGMYIAYYGLTLLRVYTTWFMVLLFFIFAIIAVRQFRRFNAARILMLGFVIFFMVLCFGNVDGLIARYNIDRYNQGTLESLDVEALGDLSDAAVPYMYELYLETDDDDLKNSLAEAIAKDPSMVDRMGHDVSFRDFNLQAYKADRIRSLI